MKGDFRGSQQTFTKEKRFGIRREFENRRIRAYGVDSLCLRLYHNTVEKSSWISHVPTSHAFERERDIHMPEATKC
jgi:hypothetical protein